MDRTDFNPIAIIGMGGIYPKSRNPVEYWQLLRDGLMGIEKIPESHWSVQEYFAADKKASDKTYGSHGGFIPPTNFDPLQFGIPPQTLEATDSAQLFALLAATMALEDAGLDLKSHLQKNETNRTKLSTIIGVTGAQELVIPLGARLGYPKWQAALERAGLAKDKIETIIEDIKSQYVEWQEASFPGLLGNVIAGRLANRLDFGGTNCVVDAACASSFSALHLACLELQTGVADIAISGGVDTFNDIFMYMCFSKTPALSPTGYARPFCESGDGTTLGEAASLFVLKRLRDAEADGDRIYAVIRGLGSSSDGKGTAIYAPNSDGQAVAIRRAYACAGYAADTVELVEAHGTGTKVGDQVELDGLQKVFHKDSERRSWRFIGSVKAQIGHTKAAAGAAGLAKAALALYHKVIPPAAHVQTPNQTLQKPETSFAVTPRPLPWLANADHPRRACVSAFGFGGSNFHVTLEEYQTSKPTVDWDLAPQICLFSADSKAEVLQMIRQSANTEDLNLAAADLRKKFKSSQAVRAGLVCKGPQQLGEFADWLATLSEAEANWQNRGFFNANPAKKNCVAIFPGQGSQYPQMLSDLFLAFPEAMELSDQLDNGPEDWRQFILPSRYAAFYGAEELTQADLNLRRTDRAQSMLALVEGALWKVLRRFSFKAEAFAGHSFGELTALWAAGELQDSTDFLNLAKRRGELMHEASLAGESSGLLAVRADLQETEAAIAASGLELYIANENSAKQTIVGGALNEIKSFVTVLQEKKISSTLLNVSAAFHTKFVAPAAEAFRQSLKQANWLAKPGAANSPCYSGYSSRPYAGSQEEKQKTLSSQLANPFRFKSLVEAILEQHGSNVVFCEIGPGKATQGLLKQIAPHCKAVAYDRNFGLQSPLMDLASFLAELSVAGVELDLTAWRSQEKPWFLGKNETKQARPGSLMIRGANYRSPKPAKKKVEINVEPITVPLQQQKQDHLQQQANPNKDGRVNDKPDMNLRDQSTNQDAGNRMQAGNQSWLGGLIQDNIQFMKQMGEQTAKLHEQFLKQQLDNQQRLFQLMEKQVDFMRGESPDFSMMRSAPSSSSASVVPMPAQSNQTVQQRAVSQAVAPQEAAPLVEPKKQSAASQDSSIAATVLQVVSQQTGYPVESLNASMLLEEDLGIDSIKRVEILSVLGEKLAFDENSSALQGLRHAKAIADIINLLQESSSQTQADLNHVDSKLLSQVQTDKPSAHAGAQSTNAMSALVLDVIAAKTGYPVESLAPDMLLEEDLGIDSIKRVEIMSEISQRLNLADDPSTANMGSLRSVRDLMQLSQPEQSPVTVPVQQEMLKPIEPDLVSTPMIKEQGGALPYDLQVQELRLRAYDGSSGQSIVGMPYGGTFLFYGSKTELNQRLEKRLKNLGIKVLWAQPGVTASTNKPESLVGLILWAGLGEQDWDRGSWLSGALANMQTFRRATSGERKSKHQALILGITSLGGGFALDEVQSSPVLLEQSSLISGMVKTASREWTDVSCKVIDCPIGDVDIWEAVFIEQVLKTGKLEVGINSLGKCFEPTLENVAMEATNAGQRKISSGTLVVSGGGRGVTAVVAQRLAKDFSGKLAILGRTEIPSDLREFQDCQDLNSLKKRVIELHREDQVLTPKEIRTRAENIQHALNLSRQMQELKSAGVEAEYFPCNVANSQSVAEVVAKIRKHFPEPIVGLVHGAGILRDKLIMDKDPAQFMQVYETKVDGLFNLANTLRNDPLEFIVLFSSTTARFGRIGQCDYAAANEYLNKWASEEAAKRPNCLVLSANWGPWAGGMVGAELEKVFASEGLGLIGLEEGAALCSQLVRQLQTPGRGSKHHEVSVLKKVNFSTQNQSDALTALRQGAGTRLEPMENEVLLSTTLSPDLAFLKDHQLADRPVLPAAMMLELFAQAAFKDLPGFNLRRLQNFQVLKGITFDRHQPRQLEVIKHAETLTESGAVLHLKLQSLGEKSPHASANLHLDQNKQDPMIYLNLKDMPKSIQIIDPAKAYRDVLFHGPELQILQKAGVSIGGFYGEINCEKQPKHWLGSPDQGSHPWLDHWVLSPAAFDGTFQLLILWSQSFGGSRCLPIEVGQVETGGTGKNSPRPSQALKQMIVWGRVHSFKHGMIRAEVWICDREGHVLWHLKDVKGIADGSLQKAFKAPEKVVMPMSESLN